MKNNTPDSSYTPKVGDLVVALADRSRKLQGYIAEIGLGWFRMHYGPVIPNSHIYKYLERHGAPIPSGTPSLPQDVF